MPDAGRRGLKCHSRLFVRCADARPQFDGHARACRTAYVLSERRTRPETELCVEHASRCKCVQGTCLETHPPVVPISGDRKEMLDQGPSDSLAPGGLHRMHRFQLGMSLVELFEGPDPDESPSNRALKNVTAGSSKSSRAKA